MKKDAYYFSHDSNAHDDPKIVELIDALGLEGYGIFWILIETLRQEADFKYPLKLVKSIAKRYGTSEEKVKAVVGGYTLFDHDETHFWSPSLCRRMAEREEIRLIAAAAGIRSGEVRKAKALLLKAGSTDVEQMLNGRSTDVEQGKERKGKENKGNTKVNKGNTKVNTKDKESTDQSKKRYGQFQNVALLDIEYEKLVNNLTEPLALDYIERLSEWKKSTGKIKKDDYATILTWYRRDGQGARYPTRSAAPAPAAAPAKSNLGNAADIINLINGDQDNGKHN